MRATYITREAATVHRQGALLLVRQNRQDVGRVMLEGLEQLVLQGNIVLTPQALGILVDRGVDTVFLTHSGKYRGRLVNGVSGSVRLRVAQYELLRNSEKVLEIARAIVAGKIANMRSFLLRIGRERARTKEQSKSLISMKASAARLALSRSLDEIRGCEGSATAAYFRCFDDAIVAETFSFNGRNRRPPLDPVNALLSFGYTLLHNVVEASVNIVGLDPYIGTLHDLETNRPSLVCDLVEEYRAPVVDRLVVAALNKKVFRAGDFEDCGKGEPVLIKREAVKRFVSAFERRLQGKVVYTPQDRRLTFRQIIEQQVRHFARVVLSRDDAYRAFESR